MAVLKPVAIRYIPSMMTILLTFLAFAVPHASAASPREELKVIVAQIKAKPDDRSLREKAIALARKVKPAVPAEAKRTFVMAVTYQKEAKTPADFTLAIDAFQDALKAAPWWGDAYYNLSVSLESAGRLDEAKDALEFYLLTKPKDAEAAQNRLYALDAKKNMAAKAAAAKRSTTEGSWEHAASAIIIKVVKRDGGFDALNAGRQTCVRDVKATETTVGYDMGSTNVRGCTYDNFWTGVRCQLSGETTLNCQFEWHMTDANRGPIIMNTTTEQMSRIN
jgi:hypothetical protein